MKTIILSYLVVILVLLVIVLSEVHGQLQSNNNEIIATGSKPGGWMKTAQNFLAGPAGELVTQMAKELISRSGGTSQILSLNLGNLFVLILLKALIFGVSMIGAGNWSHYARRLDIEDNLILPGEPPLMIGYLAAEGSGREGCLHKAACRAPKVAFEYARAGKALLNGVMIFQSELIDKERYQALIDLVEKSAYDGYKGAPCDLIYRCDL